MEPEAIAAEAVASAVTGSVVGTPWGAIVATVVAVGGLAAAFLAARGKAKAARIVEALVRGIEAGASALDAKTPDAEVGKTLKTQVKAFAGEAGVQSDLHSIVRRITGGGK